MHRAAGAAHQVVLGYLCAQHGQLKKCSSERTTVIEQSFRWHLWLLEELQARHVNGFAGRQWHWRGDGVRCSQGRINLIYGGCWNHGSDQGDGASDVRCGHGGAIGSAVEIGWQTRVNLRSWSQKELARIKPESLHVCEGCHLPCVLICGAHLHRFGHTCWESNASSDAVVSGRNCTSSNGCCCWCRNRHAGTAYSGTWGGWFAPRHRSLQSIVSPLGSVARFAGHRCPPCRLLCLRSERWGCLCWHLPVECEGLVLGTACAKSSAEA